MKPISMATLVSWIITMGLMVIVGIMFMADSGNSDGNTGLNFAITATGAVGAVAVCLSIINLVWSAIEKRKD